MGSRVERQQLDMLTASSQSRKGRRYWGFFHIHVQENPGECACIWSMEHSQCRPHVNNNQDRAMNFPCFHFLHKGISEISGEPNPRCMVIAKKA